MFVEHQIDWCLFGSLSVTALSLVSVSQTIIVSYILNSGLLSSVWVCLILIRALSLLIKAFPPPKGLLLLYLFIFAVLLSHTLTHSLTQFACLKSAFLKTLSSWFWVCGFLELA